MRRAFRIFVFVACIAFSAAGAYNVMSDNIEVERMAQATACDGEARACVAQKTAMERTPFAQTFDFSTPKKAVSVRCSRALVMVGDYKCVVR